MSDGPRKHLARSYGPLAISVGVHLVAALALSYALVGPGAVGPVDPALQVTLSESEPKPPEPTPPPPPEERPEPPPPPEPLAEPQPAPPEPPPEPVVIAIVEPPSLAPEVDPLEDYKRVVTGLVDAKKRYPFSARRRRIEGTVVATLSIGPDGALEDLALAGEAPRALVNAARKAVRAASPFPPPPNGRVRIRFRIVFRIDG